MSRSRMKKWVTVALGVPTLMLALTVPVSAHVVGSAGDPDCLGQRVSHGASHSSVWGGHGLTPVERRDLAEEVFNEETPNIGVWIKFVKTCPAPPDE